VHCFAIITFLVWNNIQRATMDRIKTTVVKGSHGR